MSDPVELEANYDQSYTFIRLEQGAPNMSLIVKTTYSVRDADKASFLADFSVVAQATMAAPACDWIYVAEDLEEDSSKRGKSVVTLAKSHGPLRDAACRFSVTVRFAKQRRPSGTRPMPKRAA